MDKAEFGEEQAFDDMVDQFMLAVRFAGVDAERESAQQSLRSAGAVQVALGDGAPPTGMCDLGKSASDSELTPCMDDEEEYKKYMGMVNDPDSIPVL